MIYSGIVIVSDLDGTLLDSERRLSHKNREAIYQFIEGGGCFGIATGRGESTTTTCFPDLPVNIPSIFFNGALIYDTVHRKIVRAQLMPSGLVDFFQRFLDRYPEMGMEINVAGKAYMPRRNEILDEQAKREGLEIVEAGWEQIPDGWYKLLMAASHECLSEVREVFERESKADIGIVFSESRLLDVMARDASKGNALAYLRECYGWKKVVVVGDNDNDITMLKVADVGIAVDNASPGMKAAADYVIASHEHPCIPQIMKMIEEVC